MAGRTKEFAHLATGDESRPPSYSRIGASFTEEQLEAFCDALRANKSLLTLTLNNCALNDKAIEKIATALANHPSLHKLSLQGNSIGEEGAASLKKLLETNQTITFLNLSENTSMVGESFHHIADGIKAHPAMEEIHLYHVRDIPEDGMIALANAARLAPNMKFFGFTSKDLGEKASCALGQLITESETLSAISIEARNISGASHIFEALRQNKTLCTIDIGSSSFTREDAKQFGEVVLESGNKNLLKVSLLSSELDSLTQRNKEKAKTVFKALAPDDALLHATPDILREYTQRRNAIYEVATEQLATSKKTTKKVMELADAYIAALPVLDLESDFTFESLTTADESGHSLLDNPRNWESFAEIITILQARGTPITKAQLGQRNKYGQTYLELAAACEQLFPLLDGLKENGEYITLEDLISDKKEPTPLLAHIVSTHATAQLFQPERMRGHSPSQATKLYNSLPPEAQETIHNMHTLLAKLRPTSLKNAL